MAQRQAAGASGADPVVDTRTAELVAILGEISELSRRHRRQEEELREERRILAEERRGLANAEAALRASRAEISEARRQFEAERAELAEGRRQLEADRRASRAEADQRAARAAHAEVDEAAEVARRQATAELQAALEQERKKTEAQIKAAEAIQALYKGQLAEKDLELRDQLERADRRDRMKEARIRELTKDLEEAKEAAATMDVPPPLATEVPAEPQHTEAGSTTRRRLSYSTEEVNG